jgi:hypothetical protein
MILITGKIFWAKVNPNKPVRNKFSDKYQWSFDLSLDKDQIKKLTDAGMKRSYIKDKDDERGKFLTFARDAVKKSGDRGKPFSIVDSAKKPWPEGKLIGNGSTVNVKIELNNRKDPKGNEFLKPAALALQVWELIEFEGKSDGEDFPVNESTSNEAENW